MKFVLETFSIIFFSMYKLIRWTCFKYKPKLIDLFAGLQDVPLSTRQAGRMKPSLFSHWGSHSITRAQHIIPKARKTALHFVSIDLPNPNSDRLIFRVWRIFVFPDRQLDGDINVNCCRAWLISFAIDSMNLINNYFPTLCILSFPHKRENLVEWWM